MQLYVCECRLFYRREDVSVNSAIKNRERVLLRFQRYVSLCNSLRDERVSCK